MSRDWTTESAGAIASAVRAGEVTARAVTEAHLLRIERRNAALGAFTDVTDARALMKADAIDAARRAGKPLPPLAGVPFAVKNLCDVAGLVTRAGAKINRDNAPANHDATCVERLDKAGAVLLGALNMGEYAYDFTGLNAHDGPSKNPFDPERMTGGSSGGSGGAAAAGLAALTIGSDTNGSIRVPSSFCGLFGLKPTYGAVSRAGTFPFVSAFDHIGPMARSATDLALAFDALKGPDDRDAVCHGGVGKAVTPLLEKGRGRLKVAVAGGYFARGGSPEAYEAVAKIAAALRAAETVVPPEAHRARAAAFVITMIEGGALHLDRLRERADDFDPDVRDRLIAGAMLPGAWIVKAQKIRRWFRAEMAKQFETVDAIIAPATPSVAPRRDQKTMMIDGVEQLVRPNLGLFTQPFSFIGLPVVVVPTWTGSGLPIGVQIVCAPNREDVALRLAHHLETSGVCRSRVAP